MAPVDDRADGTGEQSFSTVAAAVSLIHAVPQIAETAYQKISELWSFDETLHSTLVAFARNIHLLEMWCRAVGYTFPIPGAPLAIGPRGTVEIPDLETQLQRPQVKKRMELSLSQCLELIKLIQQGLSFVSTTNLGQIQDFLASLNSLDMTTSQESPARDIELGVGGGAIPSHQSLVDRLGVLGHATSRHRKMSETFRKTLPRIEQLVKKLAEEISNLEIFVIGAKLDVLIQVPPRLIEVDSLPHVIEETLSRVHAQDRMIFEAAINNYASLREVALTDALGDCMIQQRDLPDGLVQLRSRQQISFRDDLCLLEWIPDLLVDNEADERQVERRLGNLVHRLGMVKPEDYHILPPIHFVRHQDSDQEGICYRLLYSLPDSVRENDKLVSLADLLPTEESEEDGFECPPLEQRFKLALVLSNALRQFQTCQWLHERLSSQNILFVAPAGDLSRISLHEPFITGFGYSRLHNADSDKRQDGTMERDYYQHPLRREMGDNRKARYRYRAEFEIYSLGRILLEIAAWTRVPEDLADECLHHLKAEMGSRYADAVLWCLGKSLQSPVHGRQLSGKFALPQERGGSAWTSALIAAFEERVLMKIAGCRV